MNFRKYACSEKSHILKKIAHQVQVSNKRRQVVATQSFTTPADKTAALVFDAIIIGAGFSGLYQLHKLRDDLGLNVCVLEKGSGVGA